MNDLLLPRGYISYSAMQCFKSSKERFKREYFENGDKLNSKYLVFGKGIAKMIEEDKHHELLPDLIVYDLREYEIRVEINGVPVLCYLDDCKSDFTSFRDKKTGKTPWTPQKCQKSEQLLMYACAIRAKHGKMPRTAWIDWVETHDDKKELKGLHNDSKIEVTGRVESFKRVFDERELDRFEKELLKVAIEISEYYKLWLQNQI
jgi:hypothetical protein